jgi:hypothetical protein
MSKTKLTIAVVTENWLADGIRDLADKNAQTLSKLTLNLFQQHFGEELEAYRPNGDEHKKDRKNQIADI